jgi:hypothetical protein
MDYMTLCCSLLGGSGQMPGYLDMEPPFQMEFIFHPRGLFGTTATWSLKVGGMACAFILVDDMHSMDIFSIAYLYEWSEFCP